MDDIKSKEDAALFALKNYKERLHIALKAAKICVFEVDIINQLYTFFENSEDIFGVPGEVILNDVQLYSKLDAVGYQKAVSEYFSHPDDADVIDQAFKCIFDGASASYQARMRAGGSDYIWCQIHVTPIIENNIPIKMIGVIMDITNQRTNTEKLINALKLDSFTGLYNKKSSIELIRKSLSENSMQEHALVLLDIDGFKSFNDTYGHAVGDNIVRLVADTVKNLFRATDIVGRFGGDEFILFIKNTPSREWLIEKLHKLIRCEEGNYCCTNSIGISMFPQDATEFNLLFEKADRALYQSKLAKGKIAFFSEQNI
jgi:hypothetical protein